MVFGTRKGFAVVTPLRKRKVGGELYQRPPEIEAKLAELEWLTAQERLEQCQITDSKDPLYVPSECVLYLVRAARGGQTDKYYECLYKVLISRVLRQLPKRTERRDGESFTGAHIREQALGVFCELLADDFLDYAEQLDFYEVRFMLAVKTLRINVYREVMRDEKGKEALESDEEVGVLKKEVEEAAAGYDPFDSKIFSVADYRFELDSAIERLPDLQKRILQLLKLDIPIDSIDPNIATISKVLKKSEKTIRTHRDKAFATIHRRLTRGDY